MRKSELIDAMAAKAGITKTDAKKALDAFISTTSEALKTGDKISLVGFGTFSTIAKVERTGMNPSTKQPITIAARNAVKFKPGTELKNLVNKKQ